MTDDDSAVPSDIAMKCRQRKKRILLWLIILSALSGGIGAFIPENSEMGALSNLALGLPTLLLAIMWCHFDALERNTFLSVGMRIFLFFLYVIAFPVYLFNTRGKDAFKTFGLSLLFFGAMITTSIVTMFLSYSLGYGFGLIE